MKTMGIFMHSPQKIRQTQTETPPSYALGSFFFNVHAISVAGFASEISEPLSNSAISALGSARESQAATRSSPQRGWGEQPRYGQCWVIC